MLCLFVVSSFLFSSALLTFVVPQLMTWQFAFIRTWTVRNWRNSLRSQKPNIKTEINKVICFPFHSIPCAFISMISSNKSLYFIYNIYLIMSRRFLYSVGLLVCHILPHSHSSASTSLIRYLFALSTIRIGFRDNFQYLHHCQKSIEMIPTFCSLSCYFRLLNGRFSRWFFSSGVCVCVCAVDSLDREKNANKIDKIRIVSEYIYKSIMKLFFSSGTLINVFSSRFFIVCFEFFFCHLLLSSLSFRLCAHTGCLPLLTNEPETLLSSSFPFQWFTFHFIIYFSISLVQIID